MRTSIPLVTVALCLPGAASAATLGVPTQYATVQDAVDAAVAGDEIVLNPGDYSAEGVVDVGSKSLTITGIGAPVFPAFTGAAVQLTIRGGALQCTERAIEILDNASSTTLEDLTASGCALTDSLIRVEGDLVLRDSTFEEMESTGAGTVVALFGDHTVERVTFRNVSAVADAACDPLVEACATGAGFAAWLTNLVVIDGTFDGCEADHASCMLVIGGESLVGVYGTITVSGLSVSGAAGSTSVVRIEDVSDLGITDSSFVDNTVTAGGAVVIDSSQADNDAIVTVENVRFERNTVSGDAAALEIRGRQDSPGESVVLRTSWFCGNSNDSGPSDLLVDSVDTAAVQGVAFALGAGTSSAEMRSSDGLFTNVTFAGHSGDAVANSDAIDLGSSTFTSVLFTDLGGYAHAASPFALGGGTYSALWAAGGWSGTQLDAHFDANSVQQDPAFQGYVDRFTTTCDTANLWLAVGSPMREAGDPGVFDLDGTASDIGAYGGPDADLADTDDDGAFADLDCDDGDATVLPGASEVAYDGLDQDCDGADLDDVDGDGEASVVVGGPDCDDDDPAVYAGAIEIWYDGIDGDCDGADDFDQDGDGDPSDQFDGGDCDDTDPMSSSLADEIWYDGVDGDCDGADDFDQDGDGFPSDDHGGLDCDDTDAEVAPGLEELWYDGVDQDCDGNDLDQDDDGFQLADDCDDLDRAVNPDAADPTADGVDQDCSGTDGPTGAETGTDDPKGGCACSATGNTSGGWLALLGVFTLLARRRR